MSLKSLMINCLECPMDQLVEEIQREKARLKVMEDCKQLRIREGEKTSEMIKREQKKKQKMNEQVSKPPVQPTVPNNIQKQSQVVS